MINKLIMLVSTILFILSVHHANADSSAVPLISTFEAVCIESNGSTEFIRQWVHKENFEDVNGLDARARYAVTTDAGYAWFKQTDTTILIVSIRKITNACAVFSSNAPQSDVMEYIEKKLPQKFAERWPSAAIIKDDTGAGEYGVRRGRVITLGTSTQPVSVMISAITNERPGGLYQATIQAVFSNPKK
jgi:hypothetical protein